MMNKQALTSATEDGLLCRMTQKHITLKKKKGLSSMCKDEGWQTAVVE